jgi:hypothetical protein
MYTLLHQQSCYIVHDQQVAADDHTSQTAHTLLVYLTASHHAFMYLSAGYLGCISTSLRLGTPIADQTMFLAAYAIETLQRCTHKA